MGRHSTAEQDHTCAEATPGEIEEPSPAEPANHQTTRHPASHRMTAGSSKANCVPQCVAVKAESDTLSTRQKRKHQETVANESRMNGAQEVIASLSKVGESNFIEFANLFGLLEASIKLPRLSRQS